ncbi:hypothetical protein GIB67_027471 [Kingdonia uniflora]|uniref:Nuclear pore complex protein NUP88 n=1 Tax=Kingdonia uniflora TaxID=39325 RepID=A0A7J7MFR1_9MAGN|nr:hypothetical protein GIB67_027471 [Kingdonia uniflora]
MESSNSIAVSNSCLAIAWLESTFPELAHQAAEGDSFLALKAHPYVPFDASLSLQGPLRQVCHSDHDSEAPVAECQGKAVGLLYNLISKDSILVTAWSSGNLQIDALVDEIQPVWDVGSSPRLCVDSHDNIHRLAMICETNFDKLTIVKLDQPLDHTVWLGHPPPLLRLAVVDLALPANKDNGSCLFSMFVDSLKPERIFCLHNDGIDSIFLHFLPFTYQSRGKNEIMKAPSVNPVLSTCQGNLDFASPLCGFMALADSFGHSWIVGITSSQECIVLEMQGSDVSMPLVERTKKYHNFENLADINTPDIISKELLSEPKVVLAPQASPNMRAVTADSIEGRSTLHQYFNLFHENYVEYAHKDSDKTLVLLMIKIWFELKHHGTYLKRTVDDQNARLRESQIRIRNVEEKQPSLEERITRAVQVHTHLEERLQKLRNLPNAHKKPLSRAEREFKSEIDRFTGVELDALHSSIGVLHARLRKHSQSPQSNSPRQAQGRKKTHVADSQISYLRSAIEKLSLVNSENSKKAKLVESALSNKESS